MTVTRTVVVGCITEGQKAAIRRLIHAGRELRVTRPNADLVDAMFAIDEYAPTRQGNHFAIVAWRAFQRYANPTHPGRQDG